MKQEILLFTCPLGSYSRGNNPDARCLKHANTLEPLAVENQSALEEIRASLGIKWE